MSFTRLEPFYSKIEALKGIGNILSCRLLIDFSKATPYEWVALYLTSYRHRPGSTTFELYVTWESIKAAFPYLDILFTVSRRHLFENISFSDNHHFDGRKARHEFLKRYGADFCTVYDVMPSIPQHYSMQTVLIYWLLAREEDQR